MSPSPVRILIADDHLIVRDGLRMILETDPQVELVGEASDGREAVELAQKLVPDVVLLDMKMPVLDGLGAVREIKSTHPTIAIVILTTFDEDDLILRGLRAGASAFLLKDTDRKTLLHTLHAASRGESLLTPKIMSRLLDRTLEQPATEEGSATPGALEDRAGLTDRELEVLVLVARGRRNKEIARFLGISERTVKAHLTHVYNKLGVDSRAAAVAEAGRRGLLAGFDASSP